MKIKGHTAIMLTDASGNVSVTEDDNMLTNGINKFLANAGWMNPTPWYSRTTDLRTSDLVSRLMGGLLLLDTAQTEDADNVTIEAGTKMIGNGAYEVTSNDTVTEMGSYNSSESGWNDAGDTLSLVWDFTTSQANGNINCVCLTSADHGYIGEGNSTSKARKTTTRSEYSNNICSLDVSADMNMVIGYHDNYLYGIQTFSDEARTTRDVKGNYLSLVRKRCPVDKLDLRDISGDGTCEIVVKEFYHWNYEWGAWSQCYWYDSCADDTYMYLVFIEFGSYSGTEQLRWWSDSLPYTLVKLKKSDLTYTITEIKPSDVGLTANLNVVLHPMGRYMLACDSDAKYYRIDTENLADTKDITNNSDLNARIDSSAGFMTETIFCWGNYKIDLEALTIENQNGGAGIGVIGYVNNRLLALYHNKNTSLANSVVSVRRYSGYLATINNLETMVSKDATKTMKVIYTLTFGED